MICDGCLEHNLRQISILSHKHPCPQSSRTKCGAEKCNCSKHRDVSWIWFQSQIVYGVGNIVEYYKGVESTKNLPLVVYLKVKEAASNKNGL